MSTDIIDRIWAEMTDRIGTDLRVVTQYDSRGYETRMREDVREQYSTEEDRELVDQTIVDQFSEQALSSQFKTGELEAVVRVFEESWVVFWAHRRDVKRGIIVSIERNGPIASMDDVDHCIQYLDSTIGPEFDP